MSKSLILLFFILSTSLHALEDHEITELIEQHSIAGHMTAHDVDEQKFELLNNRNNQPQLNRQARGVASHLLDNRVTLDLENPVIEIPVE